MKGKTLFFIRNLKPTGNSKFNNVLCNRSFSQSRFLPIFKK